MIKFGLVLAFVCLAISFNEANASLRCWSCSSSSPEGQVCTKPSTADSRQKTMYTINCNADNGRAACRKVVKTVNGNTVINRDCYVQRTSNQPSLDDCLYGVDLSFRGIGMQPSFTQNTTCDLCYNDMCNAAGNMLPKVLTILLPIILAAFLLR